MFKDFDNRLTIALLMVVIILLTKDDGVWQALHVLFLYTASFAWAFFWGPETFARFTKQK